MMKLVIVGTVIYIYICNFKKEKRAENKTALVCVYKKSG